MSSTPKRIAYGDWRGWSFYVVGDKVIAEKGEHRIERPLAAMSNWQQSAFATTDRLKEDIAEFEASGTLRPKSKLDIFLRSSLHGFVFCIALLSGLGITRIGSLLPAPLLFVLYGIAFTLGVMIGWERESNSTKK